MIAIVDYGMGNLFSVAKALAKLGAAAAATGRAADIEAAERVILPGVGAFGDGMKNLESSGLTPAIRESVARGKPFLGICLGLQLLFEGSEEEPGVKGLGIFSGRVRKIAAPGLKIPHMGWNSLRFRRPSPLFNGVGEDAYVYFVHSYHAVPAEPDLVTAEADYGGAVVAAVGRGNVQATQFHPEKSSDVGMAILKNFVQM